MNPVHSFAASTSTRWYRAALLATAALLCTTAAQGQADPAGAPGQPATAPADVERWLRAHGAECANPRGLVIQGAEVTVACGAAGLWQLVEVPRAAGAAAEPADYRIAHKHDLGGEVVGLFVQGDRLWAEVATRVAKPVAAISGPAWVWSGGSATPTVANADSQAEPSGPTAEPPASHGGGEPAQPSGDVSAEVMAVGRVVRVHGLEVEVSLGQAQGLRAGDRVEITREWSERIVDETVAHRERIAIGRVISASQAYARVLLGINEFAVEGDEARPTRAEATGNVRVPPRAGGYWEVELVARPFVALGTLGGGVVADAAVGYRSEDAWHVQAQLAPFAFGVGSGTSLVSTAALIVGSFDARVFELGLGVGGQTVPDPELRSLDPGSALTLGQVLRVGARDGLHLYVQNHIMLFHSEFVFSAFRAAAQIPLGSQSWLVLAGGGGQMGYAFGELGLRMLMYGHGGPGSLFVQALVGGTGLFGRDEGDEFFRETEVLVGPMVGLGAEWRL